jgi:hypothetical protein
VLIDERRPVGDQRFAKSAADHAHRSIRETDGRQ